MPASETPRLLFVHAHPDDETLTTGGTIAHYVASGADVHVVTCTLGEEGEVIGERYAQLAVDAADQLGGYRISELTAALNALGVNEPNFLGGPGHWRDSGMEGTPPRHHQRFMDADMREAVGELVAIIRDCGPTSSSPMTPTAATAIPTTSRPTASPPQPSPHRQATTIRATPWQVPKFYWTVMSTSAMAAGLDKPGRRSRRMDCA